MALGRPQLARTFLGGSVAFAALLSACGGESRSPQREPARTTSGGQSGSTGGGSSGTISGGFSGSIGGSSGSSGSLADGGTGDPAVPRLDGIPVGDCRVPTPEEHEILGCPTSPPTEGATCDVPEGTTCAYAL